jgi:hypothetical protein
MLIAHADQHQPHQPSLPQHEVAQHQLGAQDGQHDQLCLQGAARLTKNPVTPKNFGTQLTTPKRKRSPGLETPLKIPRLKFLTKEPEIPPKKTRKNPHPNKNQQMFVKIDSKLVLLKHKGLAPSTRKAKIKKSPKSPISSTNLQIPANLQDQPTNPPNPRRRSNYFEEKIRIFQQEQTKIQRPNSTARFKSQNLRNLQNRGRNTTTQNETRKEKPRGRRLHPSARQKS